MQFVLGWKLNIRLGYRKDITSSSSVTTKKLCSICPWLFCLMNMRSQSDCLSVSSSSCNWKFYSFAKPYLTGTNRANEHSFTIHLPSYRLKFVVCGREPWSSGYGRRLVFWRSWVPILALYTYWMDIFRRWIMRERKTNKWKKCCPFKIENRLVKLRDWLLTTKHRMFYVTSSGEPTFRRSWLGNSAKDSYKKIVKLSRRS